MSVLTSLNMDTSKADEPQSFEGLCKAAIDEFLDEAKQKGSAKNSFVEVVSKIRQSGDAKAKDDELESARNFIQNLEQTKRDDRTFRILEKINPFLERFGALIKACEGCLQAAPFGVAIAFTGLRLVLNLATKAHEAMSAVLGALSEISPCLEYFRVVIEGIFRTREASASLVLKTIKQSYKRILEFWCRSSDILSRRTLSSPLKFMLNDFKQEVRDFQEGINHDAERVDRLLTVTAHSIDKKQICEWIASGSQGLSWLKQHTFLKEYEASRTEGTCQWFYETPQFKSWKAAERNTILWYNADPGTGKTFLMSAITSHLQAQLDSKVVYFFYSFSDPARRVIFNGVRSLAIQLLKGLNPLPLGLIKEYDEAIDQGNFSLGSEDSETLEKVLNILLNRYSQVYIALDGLDECLENRVKLSKSLESLFNLRTRGTVKWFLTSHDVSEIRNTLEEFNAIEVRPNIEAISMDIWTYRKARGMCPAHDDPSFDDKEQNFLYTRLLCDRMKNKSFQRAEEDWTSFQDYPDDLRGLYLSALGRIAKLGYEQRRLARQVFQILTLSQKRLTVDELLDALNLHVIINARYPTRDPSREISILKDICSPLLVTEGYKEFQTVGLCHHTVKDFFLEPKNKHVAAEDLKGFFVDEKKASGEFGIECLRYLSRKCPEDPLHLKELVRETNIREDYAFLSYAATFWYYHLWSAEPTPEIVTEVVRFLRSSAFWACTYIQSHVAPYLFARYKQLENNSSFRPVMGIAVDKSTKFALPLPEWMGDYSAECVSLDRSFCEFVQDWGELLVKTPDRLDNAAPLTHYQPGCHLRAPNDHSKVWIRRVSEFIYESTDLRVIDTSFSSRKKKKRSGRLQLDLIREEGDGLDCRVDYFQITVFSRPTPILIRKPLHQFQGFGKGWILTLVQDKKEGQNLLQAWRIDPHDLSVYRSLTPMHKIDPRLHRELPSDDKRKNTWKLLQANVVTQSAREQATPTIRIFHLYWDHQDSNQTQNHPDSKYATPDTSNSTIVNTYSEDDFDSDSDTETSGSEAESDSVLENRSNCSESLSRDCLIIASDYGKPTWLPIKLKGYRWYRLVGACHPEHKIVAVSFKPGRIDIVNYGDASCTWAAIMEEEGKEAAEVEACSRELQFSPCGNYLFLLSISFYKAGLDTDCVVSLSTYLFTVPTPSTYTLQACINGLSTIINYRFSQKIEEVTHPFIISHWTADNVIIALPPLAYNPKIVKVSLKIPENQASACKRPLTTMETLSKPIFFPKSTISRNAHIRYWDGSSNGEDSFFYLVMDRSEMLSSTPEIASSCGPGQVLTFGDSRSPGDDNKVVISPPLVMRWKIAYSGKYEKPEIEEQDGEDVERQAWRVWAEKDDSTSEDIKARTKALTEKQKLSGRFIGLPYEVPIRSGLDWTREGFLTC